MRTSKVLESSVLNNREKARLWTAYRNSWILDERLGRWTLDAGLWTLDSGRWTLDPGCYT